MFQSIAIDIFIDVKNNFDTRDFPGLEKCNFTKNITQNEIIFKSNKPVQDEEFEKGKRLIFDFLKNITNIYCIIA